MKNPLNKRVTAPILYRIGSKSVRFCANGTGSEQCKFKKKRAFLFFFPSNTFFLVSLLSLALSPHRFSLHASFPP